MPIELLGGLSGGLRKKERSYRLNENSATSNGATISASSGLRT